MFRTSFVFLVAALVCSANSAAVPVNTKLTFLGKITSPLSTSSSKSECQGETSYYFLSQNAAAWATAAADCKANLGDTASLVNIETPEELQEIIGFLGSSDDTGSTYWTAGRYDNGKFVWEDGTEIGDDAPWDVGHPNTRTPVTRVLAYTVGGLVLRTDFQTVSYRYICELIV